MVYYQKSLKIKCRVSGVDESQVNKNNVNHLNIQNSKQSIDISTNHISEVDRKQHVESSLSKMIEIGFLDIDVNKEALQETKGDLFEAREYLEEKKEQGERIINNSSSSTSSNLENFEHEYIGEVDRQQNLESSLLF